MTKFFVACGKGLEYLLADELVALGCSRATATVAGANAEGSLEQALRAVLWSRLASRVRWPIAEFPCPDESTLYERVYALPWHEHLDASLTFAVDTILRGGGVSGTGDPDGPRDAAAGELTHSRFVAQRVKDAVVDQLRDRLGQRPSVDVASPDVRLSLVLHRGIATLSIDLGGGSLHRRGWRSQQGAAPLKETVAAAVLLRGGWSPTLWSDGGLCDPMCGSGTLLLEGAAMAADCAPGLSRFGERPPSRWFGFDLKRWRALLDEAKQRASVGRAQLDVDAFEGSDHDPQAIEGAQKNAELAGFGLRFSVREVRALPATSRARGLLASNPPYDERMAADVALYRELGDTIRAARPGWNVSLLCGNSELSRATGLRAKKVYPIANGSLECSLLVCR